MRTTLRVNWLPIAGAMILLALLAIACRGSSLVSAQMLNPDEAELLASGRRAALNLSPYVTYTTPTYLALWPMFMGILAIAGVPMALPTAHVLSGLSYVWIALAGWFLVSRRFGWLRSAVFVLPPTAVLLVGPESRPPDFLALGTELLPVSIIMLGALVLLAPDGPPTLRRLAVASALAGVAIWAKPQVIFLAGALCLVGLLIRRLEPEPKVSGDEPRGGLAARGWWGTGSWREPLLVAAAFAAPSAALLLIIVLQGTLAVFISEPVALIFGYLLRSGVELNPGHPFTLADRASALVAALRPHLVALVWILPGLAGMLSVWQSASRRTRVIGSLVVMGPVAAAVLTLGILNPIFDHYLNILYAACMLSGIAGIAVAQLTDPVRPQPRRPARKLLVAGAVAVLAASLLAAVVRPGLVRWLSASLPDVTGNAAAVVNAVAGHPLAVAEPTQRVLAACPARARVFVWGWAAELYGEFDWTPASRYVTAWPLAPWGRPKVYRATLFSEITADPPACVIEAIGPSFFGYLDEKSSIAARMPELADYLANCYTSAQESLAGARPVTLWIPNGSCAPG